MLGSAEFGDAVVVADLEAGIGTLTRLAEATVDRVVVVVEPTAKSIEVGTRAVELARDKALGQLVIVANRIASDADRAVIRDTFGDADVVAVPYDDAIVRAERDGTAPLDVAPDAPGVQALVGLAQRLV